MTGDEQDDYWTVAGDTMIRHHITPRENLYVPSDDDTPPIPLKFIDVPRITYTNLDHISEARIEDSWLAGDVSRALSGS